MSCLYARTRNTLQGAARRQIEADQSRWLRGRYGCGLDLICINDAYNQRIRELEAACIAARAGCTM